MKWGWSGGGVSIVCERTSLALTGNEKLTYEISQQGAEILFRGCPLVSFGIKPSKTWVVIMSVLRTFY